ncbi:hypothetical protein CC86DRAFT_339928 [Ophiobolus disseminans]|uniref:FAD-binding FR-type domain-containing protein n=1 Tax=Ophiobolus disseminans TaxID=1469910 RepID=A0A6A7AFJ2_9PLEO|nr:hypothetical protein CC86DRAFT_339928 [Ophiobolus disseminans]
MAITALPLGSVALLLAYFIAAAALLLWVFAPIFSEHFLDDLAFRAAWLTLTQIPLVFLLSTKRGPLNLFAGLSHERMNWLHHWIGRMILMSATTHVVIMKSSVSSEEILHSKDRSMTVVRYGTATYAFLTWIGISSIIPLRRWSYRAFYINHYASTSAFLIIAFQHVPTFARAPIYLSAGILALDKLITAYAFISNNVSIAPPLYIPALGRWEMHPFTPANCSSAPAPPLPPRKNSDAESGLSLKQANPTSEMLLLVKTKSGFTKRLAAYHKSWLARPCPNATKSPDDDLTAYIDGPYGAAPAWHDYENLVLVASSTGVSFVLAILDYLEQLCLTNSSSDLPTKTVKIVWMTRHIDTRLDEVVMDSMTRGAATLSDFGINVTAEVYTTCANSHTHPQPALHEYDAFAHLRQPTRTPLSSRPPLSIRHPDEIYDEWDREAEMEARRWAEPWNDEYAAYEEESDDTCTLIDEQENRESDERDDWMEDLEDEDDGFLGESVDVDGDARGSCRTSVEVASDSAACQCALIQYQRRKLESRAMRLEHVTQHYGRRPDIPRAIRDGGCEGRAMVAVCSNGGIVGEVRETVAGMNMKFVRGERGDRVELYVEKRS